MYNLVVGHGVGSWLAGIERWRFAAPHGQKMTFFGQKKPPNRNYDATLSCWPCWIQIPRIYPAQILVVFLPEFYAHSSCQPS